jgi:hypothetical protein
MKRGQVLKYKKIYKKGYYTKTDISRPDPFADPFAKVKRPEIEKYGFLGCQGLKSRQECIDFSMR